MLTKRMVSAMKTINILVNLKAKKGLEKDLEIKLRNLQSCTRGEVGCLDYRLMKSIKDPSIWTLYEQWISQVALDTHLQSQHYQDFSEIVNKLTDGPMAAEFYEAINF